MTNEEIYKLNEMEVDVIGEVMNISMGAAATAMSNILDKKVNITTPRIEQIDINEFEFSYLEPVVGVLIRYIEGIDGSNMLLLKEVDLKKILGHLLSMNPNDILELDEISISAICEIMNQMMGSASSALATFLGRVVNISPPEIMDTTDAAKVRQLFSSNTNSLVSIKFNLSIDGLIDSEFISAMEPHLAKEIVKMSYGISEAEPDIPEPEITAAIQAEEATAAMAVEEARAATATTASTVSTVSTATTAAAQVAADAYAQAAAAMNESSVPGPAYSEPAKTKVQATPYTYKQLAPESSDINLNESNFDLIMSVPIQITVELGKTKKKIKDIAELTVGNIVELERQAGDQVDVVANGRLIARGDVVVVDDNYSVRITEIMKAKENV